MQSNATPRWAESTTAAVDAAAIGHLSGSGLALAVLAGTRRFRNQTLVNARRNCRWAHPPSLQEEMRHACAMESSDTYHGSMAGCRHRIGPGQPAQRSEEHTSELQSLMRNLVCRLLLEKQKN